MNVCPEHAIISGDMEDETTEIAQLLARQAVNVRKPEKGTLPNLFYIGADEVSLNPTATPKTGEYLWSTQTTGVGHFAKEAEKLAFSNGDVITSLLETEKQYSSAGEIAKNGPQKSIELIMGKSARGGEAKRVYDTPDKGILWGWEVSAYVFTKAIAAGAFLVPFIALLFGWARPDTEIAWWSYGLGLFFLTATGILLIMDLDQPKRFFYVLLRPHWGSWLVKGGYAITTYGGLLTALGATLYFGWDALYTGLSWVTAIVAAIVAIYTAFLFAQAKGRDFWQSPTLAIHMLVHSLMAGAAAFAIIALFIDATTDWMTYLRYLLYGTIAMNLVTMLFELTTTHPTVDAGRVSDMITKGQYSKLFYGGVVLLGNIIPVILLMMSANNPMLMATVGALVLLGIYFTEHIWVEAPQRISLT